MSNNNNTSCCSINNNNNNNSININEQPIIRRRIILSSKKKTGLIQYAKDYTSQNGEDGIIEKIFDMIHHNNQNNASFSQCCQQQQQQEKYYYCVDVGAWDGKHLSNSYSLLVPSSSSKSSKSKSSKSSSSSSMTSDDGGGDGDGDGDDDDDGRQQEKRKYDKQPSSITKKNTVRSSSKWRGLLIEADQQRYKQLCKLHEPLGNICINSTVTCNINDDDDDDVNSGSNYNSNTNKSSSRSTSTTLPSILKFHVPDLPKDFDFISIDVDGPDYWILYDLLVFHNNYYKPKVICIEANPTMPNDLIYIPPRSNTIRHGASLAAIVELAESYGYVLVAKTIYNAFFIYKNLYEQNSDFTELVPDTSIDAITRNGNVDGGEQLTMGTSLYQLYDGTIKLWGCKKLLWHRKTINEEQIQVLKPSERGFPFSPPPSSSSTSTTKQQQQPVRSSKDYNIINLSPYCGGDCDGDDKKEKKKEDCSEALINQLKLDGFALVNGFSSSPSSSQTDAANAAKQQEQNNDNNNILLSNELCQNALKVSNMFLHDADEAVRRSSMSIKDRARRGYSPINTENFASLLGNHGPNDLVRKFRIGPTTTTSTTTSEQSESATTEQKEEEEEEGQAQQQQKGNNSPLLQPNIWPNPNIWDPESCHIFQSTVEEYYDGICKVANIIVTAICDGLIAKQPHLKDRLGQSMNNIQTTTTTMDCNSSGSPSSNSGHHDTSILTLLGYSKGTRHNNNKTQQQQQKTKKKKKRVIHPLVAAHTDVGIITVLLFDDGDCAVLQRQVINEEDGDDGDYSSKKSEPKWADVTLPNDTTSSSGGPTFVVNIADCLSELSGNYLPSTIHRVMPSNDGLSTPRNCLALFVGLDPKQTLYFNNNTNNNTTTNTGSKDSSSTIDDGEGGGGGDGRDEKQRNTKTMTYEEWRKQRIIKSQTVLKQQKQQQQHPGKKL